MASRCPAPSQDGSDAEARADVALANTLAGFVESLSSCTSEHAIEHAMSGFHPKLPHGAGLIMISLEYYKLFADVCADKFTHMAHALGRADGDFVAALAELQKQCGVDNLKMSDYGMENGDFGKYADHAFADMGGLFRVDAKQLTQERHHRHSVAQLSLNLHFSPEGSNASCHSNMYL